MRGSRAIVLAIVCSALPGPASARGPAPAEELPSVEPTAEPDPALAAAEQLYNEGLADYETFEYEGAIDKWTRAFGKLGAAPDTAEMRNAIVYNIARAREKAYEQSGDLAHLRKAKALLERYVAEESATASPDPDDLATARARVAELGERIATIERAAKPKPKATPTNDASRDEGPRGPGRPLVITGGVLLAVGAGLAVGGIAAGAVLGRRADRDVPELDELGDERARQDRVADGRRANRLMIACGVAGGVMAVTGIVLLAVGAAKQRRASKVAIAPTFSPALAGLTLRGRF